MSDVTLNTAPPKEKVETPFARFVADYCTSTVAVAALAVVFVLIVLSALAPWIAPQNPYDLSQISILDNMLAPGERSLDGNLYLLGTDDQGRDMLSAMFYGLKLSFFVGIVAT